MSEYCVVVAAGSAARIFTLEPAEVPEIESGPNLIERTTLIAPGQPADENAPVHSYDHGRQQHDREAVRKFAREIAAAIERTINRDGLQHVVVCADKRLLGTLRPAINDGLNRRVAVREVPKDLAKLSSRQLHDKLSVDGHLPRRRRRAIAQ
jgi:protein required for attachment to host cells